MTPQSIAALFATLITLAAIPSISVLTVVARTTSAGLWQGCLTALGIVLGDLLWIILAVYGMAAIAHTFGQFFFLLKYLGAAYLWFRGVSLWRSRPSMTTLDQASSSSQLSSLLSGLLITLGDQKAVLFYMGFLPAFMDLSQVTWVDTVVVMGTAAVAVGGVKLGYAVLAERVRSRVVQSQVHAKASLIINRIAGVILIATGIALVVKS